MCFAHVGRVLRKGGVIALGDWTIGAGSTTEPPETQRVVRRPDGLVLIFEPLAHYLHGLKDSDFTAITTRGHSGWLLDRTRRELDMQDEHTAAHASMLQRIEVTERRLQSLQSGRLQHGHLQATKAP